MRVTSAYGRFGWQKVSDAIVSMNVMLQIPPFVGMTDHSAMLSIGTIVQH